MEQKSVPLFKYDPNDLFRFIVRYKRACDGNSPTYRDIMTACGLKSTSHVNYYLKRLERHGRIRLLTDKSARSIVVVGGTWVAPAHGLE